MYMHTSWLWSANIVLFFFFFRIVLDLRKSCKDSTESSSVPEPSFLYCWLSSLLVKYTGALSFPSWRGLLASTCSHISQFISEAAGALQSGEPHLPWSVSCVISLLPGPYVFLSVFLAFCFLLLCLFTSLFSCSTSSRKTLHVWQRLYFTFTFSWYLLGLES